MSMDDPMLPTDEETAHELSKNNGIKRGKANQADIKEQHDNAIKLVKDFKIWFYHSELQVYDLKAKLHVQVASRGAFLDKSKEKIDKLTLEFDIMKSLHTKIDT